MSALTLERLQFDPTAVSDGPLIGSYLVGSGGTVITETGTALDVNVTDGTNDLAIDGSGFITANINGTVTIDATDLDIRSLNVATDGDHVYITDSTGANALSVDASGYITANINGTVTVDATDFDIRDLSAAQDNVAISDGTDTLAVNTDGSINAVVLGDADDAALTYNPIHVGSVSADQSSALSAISAAGDSASLTSDLYRRVFINDAPNVSMAAAAVTAGLTEIALPTTPLAGRTRLMIQNNGDKPLFVGPTGVTTSSGIEVAKGGTLALEAGEALAFYGISTAASQDIRVFELA